MLTVTALLLLTSATIESNGPKNTQSESDYSQPSDVPAVHIESSEQSVPSQGESGLVPSEPDSPSESNISESKDNSPESGSTVSKEPEPLIVKGDTKGVGEDKLLKLEEILKAQTNSVSFYYENLETGTVIASTPDKVYFCASVIKAPFIASVLKTGIELSDTVTIREAVSNIPAGTEMTVDKLIYYTIVHSDNNSYIELVRKYGKKVFNEYSVKLGITSRLGSGNFCNMTAYEAAVYFKDIYRSRRRAERKIPNRLYERTAYNQQIGRALGKKYDVVQKYGASYKRSVFHNTAIVYAPSRMYYPSLQIFTVGGLYPCVQRYSVCH
jgi:hypothetical protein